MNEIFEEVNENTQRPQIRNPYTREEVEARLEEHVQRTEKQWGADYVYTKWAREGKKKKMQQFDNGEVIKVESEEFHKDGMDFARNFYSDGTADETCFGYTD